MARINRTASAKSTSSSTARAYTGSMKSVGRNGGSLTVNHGYGSTKTTYSSRAKDNEEERKKDTRTKANQKNISPYSDRNNRSDRRETELRRSFGSEASGSKQEKTQAVSSTKSIYNRDWERRSEDSNRYTFESYRNRKNKADEDKVNVGQLAFGIGEQAANKVVGGVTNALDLFIGTPFQQGLDYAEEKLGLPDMGVNAFTAYNKYLQDSSAKEAEYFAKNASKSKVASKLNQYAPDLVALLPEMIMAATSGGTTAVASAGVKGLGAVSKINDMSHAMKIAGNWLKNNPTAALNFLQTSGDAHKQALNEGATEQEALAYALLNGGMDAMITKYGVGAAQRGIESLPGNLRDKWKKVSNTVKSADAVAQELAEGQMYGAMQRASRGIYDGNAKLFSLSDKNAVFNPGAMIESAFMDSVSPFVMGEIDATRTKGTPEPARVDVDADVENNSHSSKRKKEKNEDKGDNTKLDEQNLEQNSSVQKVLGGEVLNSKEIQNLDMKNPVIQKLVSEKSGIPISPSDNANEALLRKKFQFAAMAIAKRNAQEKEFYSRRSIEKPEVGTYNKTKGRK